MTTRDRPIVVIGAGPAGSAAACVLAAERRGVLLLEREATPGHKICGEFLGGPALQRLAALGIDAAALGAHPIDRVRVVRGARAAETALPFQGAGLSRRVLDAALRRRAAALGAELRCGDRVEGAAADTVEVGTETIRADAVLLGTGKHELRGRPRELGRPPDDLVGFKMHFRLAPNATVALSGAVELILFDDGYVGLQLIDGGVANLCLLVGSERFREVGGCWPDLLASLVSESSHLQGRLDGATQLFLRPLAIARVPYGFIHAPQRDDGIFRLGDQMGVIPSFTGEGIAIALHTGVSAARYMLEGGGAPAYHARMRSDLSRQIATATTLYRVGRSRRGQAAMHALVGHFPGTLAMLARATRLGGATPR